ncbi:MAG: hypothetical protein JW990_19345 [Thermoleophilia bacterium]|nr:hypothetical protein [Thermoleophilia bacterium]
MTTAITRYRPQEQALARVGEELGIIKYSDDKRAMIIDLSSPELAEKYNVLYPAAELMPVDPNFTPSLNIVRINPDPAHGDVYPIESEGYGKNKRMKAGSLLKTAVEKLAEAAGLVELPPQTTREGKNLHVVAGVKARRTDGEFKPVYGSREWIHDDEYEKVVNACPKTEYNSDKPLSPEKRDEWIRKQWARVKEFREPMTESKAYLRAYRKALKLKAKYTPEELDKPFLVVSTLFTPDTSDIRILGMVMDQGRRAAGLLYGASDAAESDDLGEYVAGEVLDAETGELLPAQDPTNAAETSEPETHGDAPTDDREIPRGPLAGQMLSEICRDNPEYAREKLLPTEALGPLTEGWLRYWHGEGDDLDDVAF